MAPSRLTSQVAPEVSELRRCLQTTKFELDYERSARAVELVAKDEDIRKLRLQILLLEDENDDLHDELENEQARADDLEVKLDAALSECELSDANVQRITNELRMLNRQVDTQQAELNAMQHVSADTTKLLTEKLALARELTTLKPELEHLRSQAIFQQNLLAEKLSLQRQLSTIQVELETEKRTSQKLLAKEGKRGESSAELKAEVEDLRKQVQTEKRAREKIEGDFEQVQADLASQQLAAKTAAKVRKNKKEADVEQAEELVEELASLRKELTREKRARERAEETHEQVQADLDLEKQRSEKLAAKQKRSKKEIDSQQSAEVEELREEADKLRQELQTAKQAAREAKSNKKDAEIEKAADVAALRTELANIKIRLEKAEANVQTAKKELEQEKANASDKAEAKKSKNSDEADGAPLIKLRKQLAEEQKERQLLSKEHERARKEWEGKRSILDDKLDAFRTKLRSTKESLKEKEAELQQMQSIPIAGRSSSVTAVPTKGTKNPRKRGATVDPNDATTLGTPGDVPAKRSKRAFSAAPGDKSTFSITPFLNRTTSVAPESPVSEKGNAPAASEVDKSDDIEVSNEDTPTAARAKKADPKKTKPLAMATASKSNPKTIQMRKKTASAIPSLEMVAEEANSQIENAPPVEAPKDPEASVVAKLKPASRPSKAPRKSLMSFATFDSDAPEKKKKRKLGGISAPKTLFDEEEGSQPAKPIPGKGLFAARTLGKSIFGSKAGPAISGGLRMTTEEGFQFSPLKKERKAMRESMLQ